MSRAHSFPTLLLCLLALGCAKPLKLYENGNYERAYKVALREAGGRKQVKEDDLKILAAAYTKLQLADIARVEELETGRRADRWLSLYPAYRQMLARRSEIAPLLPQMPSLDPLYDLSTLQALAERARIQAGAYCLNEAETLGTAARSGDKQAARDACEWLEKAFEYTPEDTNIASLRAEMQDLGTVRIQVAPARYQTGDEAFLVESLLEDAKTRTFPWLELHFAPPGAARIDYVLRVDATQVYVGPDEETVHTAVYCVDVEEGCRIVETVVKVNDTTTVVVIERIPIIVTVCGTVVTTDRNKYASAVLDLWLETPGGEMVTEVWSLSETNDWHNRAVDCSGDSRALPGPCFGVNFWHPSGRYMIQGLAYGMRRAVIADVRKMFR
jgi:hypothetical protein